MKKLRTLVIVESPSKGHHIQEFLGDDYIVMASRGHITELASGGRHGIGIDIDNDFKPHYILSDDKMNVLDELLAAAKICNKILICSDSDREGEAIAWHLSNRLEDTGLPIKRATFNEIKKAAVLKAVKEPRDIDMNLFHAQEARRILDRLVGFIGSPFLMNCVGPKLSCGRVQSVVTKMVIDREREIESFKPEEFWTINVCLAKDNQEFIAKYPGQLRDLSSANAIKSKLNSSDYVVSSVSAEEEKKYPQPPLITSTLQRIMSKTYGFPAEKTMKVAQSLYESGYCTYIRTDSVRVGDEALADARAWIKDHKYEHPKKANVYKNKSEIQDAHECIRPSDLSLDIINNDYLTLNDDEKTLYNVIWKYFIASQMMPAIYNTLKVTAHVKGDPTLEVKSSGKALKSKGFLEILGVDDDSKIEIPNLNKGDELQLTSKIPVRMEKKQTQPLPRYSEDKLIKQLEDKQIGRPATYADLLSKLNSRNYVERRGNVFHATDLGKKITDTLSEFFSFMDYNYSAKMEQQLDEIESGKLNHIDMLKKFYPEFKKEIDSAYISHGGMLCEKCSSPMATRTAKDGITKFFGCSAYPKCYNTKPFIVNNAA